MDLSELLEARHGRPTEDQAARKIATFAVIPAAIVGLLAGTQLVGVADPIGRLLWVCTATAFGSGFGIAFLVAPLEVLAKAGVVASGTVAATEIRAFYGGLEVALGALLIGADLHGKRREGLILCLAREPGEGAFVNRLLRSGR